MKKFILLLFNFLSSASLTTCFLIFNYQGTFAQTKAYLPLPDTNAAWIIRTDDPVCRCYYNIKFKPMGDTIINAYRYVKYSRSYDEKVYQLIGAYRSDSMGRSYFIAKDSTNEYILMDLSKNAGDTVHNILVTSPATFGNHFIVSEAIVDSVKTVFVGNYSLKTLYVRVKDGYGYNQKLSWMEKVGTSRVGILTDIHAVEYWGTTVCMSYNDTIYYEEAGGLDASKNLRYFHGSCPDVVSTEDNFQKDKKMSISPNPFTESFVIFYPSAVLTYSIKIYDYTGKEVYRGIGNAEKNIISLKNIPSGLYLVSILDEKKNQFFMQKIIKQ